MTVWIPNGNTDHKVYIDKDGNMKVIKGFKDVRILVKENFEHSKNSTDVNEKISEATFQEYQKYYEFDDVNKWENRIPEKRENKNPKPVIDNSDIKKSKEESTQDKINDLQDSIGDLFESVQDLMTAQERTTFTQRIRDFFRI